MNTAGFTTLGRRSIAPVHLALLLAACMVAAGCRAQGDDTPRSAPRGKPGATFDEAPAVPAHWRPEPVRARVYPSTRFVREDGAIVLEARIELFDEMGDSVKGVGLWHFELYAGDQVREGNVAQRLYAWDVPMMLLDEQRLYYDRITRAYLFRLKLDNAAPARRITTFRASLAMPDGSRLEASEVLEPVGVGGG